LKKAFKHKYLPAETTTLFNLTQATLFRQHQLSLGRVRRTGFSALNGRTKKTLEN
jgi:hypothetical protein